MAQARIINLERKRPILAAFLSISCDYGRSFLRFFFWCLAVIIFFILAYNFLPASLVRADNLTPSGGLWDSFYFSATTFTSLSSNLQAGSVLAKIFVLVEAAIGYLMTELLVAILVKRTSRD